MKYLILLFSLVGVQSLAAEKSGSVTLINKTGYEAAFAYFGPNCYSSSIDDDFLSDSYEACEQSSYISNGSSYIFKDLSKGFAWLPWPAKNWFVVQVYFSRVGRYYGCYDTETKKYYATEHAEQLDPRERYEITFLNKHSFSFYNCEIRKVTQ